MMRVDGEFQAVMGKPPLNKVTRWKKTAGSKPPTRLPWRAKKRQALKAAQDYWARSGEIR